MNNNDNNKSHSIFGNNNIPFSESNNIRKEKTISDIINQEDSKIKMKMKGGNSLLDRQGGLKNNIFDNRKSKNDETTNSNKNNKLTRKEKKAKKKAKKNKPIRKAIRLTKKARHLAIFIGMFFLPLMLVLLSSFLLMFTIAQMVNVNNIATMASLASPKYYAEMGSRGILGGSRAITDIPKNLIGSEPDLSVDYQHNLAMQQANKKSSGSDAELKNAGTSDLAKITQSNITKMNSDDVKKKIAKRVAQLTGAKPEILYAQYTQESGHSYTQTNSQDLNFAGIKFANKPGTTKGVLAPNKNGDDGNYARYKNLEDFCKADAILLKTSYPFAIKAKTATQYAHELKIRGYYGDSETTYARNMEAIVKQYDGGTAKTIDTSVSSSDSSSSKSKKKSKSSKKDSDDTNYLSYTGYRTQRMDYTYGNGTIAGKNGKATKIKSDKNYKGTKVTDSNHKQIMKEAGIKESDYDGIDYIVFHESTWDPHATNPKSGAYGLCQSLPGEKMASAGKDWKDNPVTQLKWMNSYCKERYGSVANAVAYWRIHSCY